MWLVVVLFDRNVLGFGLGDDLLCLALKISFDGCCERLKCWDCVVGGVVWRVWFLLVQLGLCR